MTIKLLATIFEKARGKNGAFTISEIIAFTQQALLLGDATVPNNFCLIRKSNPDAGAVVLITVDEEMCKHFGVSPHPQTYYEYWFDTIGFPLAMGKSFKDIQEGFEKAEKEAIETEDKEYIVWYDKQLAIVKWLDENFTSNAWVTVGNPR